MSYSSLPSSHSDIQKLINLAVDEQLKVFKSVSDVRTFCNSVVSFFLNDPSLKSLEILINLFFIHENSILRDEYLEYFSLPLFMNLSKCRLEVEQENSVDFNFSEALENFKQRMKSNSDNYLPVKISFLPQFVSLLVSSKSFDFSELGLEFLKVVLIQPSCRRFVKPYLEDILFIAQLKACGIKIENIIDFEKQFYFPIDEINGVPFPSVEDYILSHTVKIASLKRKLYEADNYASRFSHLPSHLFATPRDLWMALNSFNFDDLCLILSQLGCASFPLELTHASLVEAACDLLVLRSGSLNELMIALPDESSLFVDIKTTPLTVESLSVKELFSRHAKLLQKNIYHEVKSHIIESIKSCSPVLNKDMKIEFSSWTRDAIEIVSSALTRLSAPDLRKGGAFQRIELEASLSLAPLDNISKTSWSELKKSELVFLCYIGPSEDGTHELKMLRTAIVETRSTKNNILTFSLLLDPNNFDSSKRQEYSKLNLIIKRAPSESNDMRVLHILSNNLESSLPELFEDVVLGLSNPNDLSLNLNSSNKNLSQIKLSKNQEEAVLKCLNSSLSICVGPFGSGCTTALISSVMSLYKTNTNSVVILRSSGAADKLYSNLSNIGIPEHQILRLGFSSTLENIISKYRGILKNHVNLINTQLLAVLNLNPIYTCIEADYIWRSSFLPLWNTFQILLKSPQNLKDLAESYPFSLCLGFNEEESFEGHFEKIQEYFSVAKLLAPLESLESNENISKYVFQNLAKVVVLTSKYISINSKQLANLGFNFDNMIVDDCNLIPEIELLLAMTSQSYPSKLAKIALFGHFEGGKPFCNDARLGAAGCSVTLIDRFLAAGFSKLTFLTEDRVNNYPWCIWKSSSKLAASEIFDFGLKFISVPPLLGPGEESPSRGYIQNLDEAEYAVALFQYLRLNDIPADKIAIVSAYKGQVELIREIIDSRCSWTEFYSHPVYNGTIDQSHGLNFEYVIISLVRTKSPGFLSDERRFELALTRASKNLVILGSHNLFGKHFDSIIQKTGSKLCMFSGKLFDSIEEFTLHVYELSLKNLSLNHQ